MVLGLSAPVGVAFALASRVDIEMGLRWAGGVAQVLGFVAVAMGLSSTSRLFNQPGPIASFFRWLGNIPPFSRGVTIHEESISFTLKPGLSVVRLGRPKVGTVEQRLGVVEKNLSALDEQVAQFHREQLQTNARVTESLAEQARNLREEVEEIRKKLEGATVGAIWLEWVGVCFFVAGIVVSTASKEMADLL
ncbi:MAG: hypothetical protein Rhirs2KO_11340 [Rhizobiaceae bacterium]